MADRPTPIDGTDRDPELERRLTALHRLQDEVTSPPPVHELTAHVRRRRTRRFAVASTAAAAAAVIAGMLVLASRPDGDSRVTAAAPNTTDAPPTTAATLPPSGAHPQPPSVVCNKAAPTDTLDEHDLEITTVGERSSAAALTLQVANRGDHPFTIYRDPALAVVRDGTYRSVPTPNAGDSGEDEWLTIEPGETADVRFRVGDADCARGGQPLTGVQELRPVVLGDVVTEVPNPAHHETRIFVWELIGNPITMRFPNSAPTTTPPSTTTVPGRPPGAPTTTWTPASAPTTTIPAPCAPTPTVPPQPTNRSTTTGGSFEAAPCYPPTTAPPTTTTIPR